MVLLVNWTCLIDCDIIEFFGIFFASTAILMYIGFLQIYVYLNQWFGSAFHISVVGAINEIWASPVTITWLITLLLLAVVCNFAFRFLATELIHEHTVMVIKKKNTTAIVKDISERNVELKLFHPFSYIYEKITPKPIQSKFICTILL